MMVLILGQEVCWAQDAALGSCHVIQPFSGCRLTWAGRRLGRRAPFSGFARWGPLGQPGSPWALACWAVGCCWVRVFQNRLSLPLLASGSDDIKKEVLWL